MEVTLVQSLHTVFLLTDAALVKDGDDLSPASKYCFFLRADAAEQLEQSRLEMATFQQLKITETAAIPRRLETLTQVNLTK